MLKSDETHVCRVPLRLIMLRTTLGISSEESKELVELHFQVFTDYLAKQTFWKRSSPVHRHSRHSAVLSTHSHM